MQYSPRSRDRRMDSGLESTTTIESRLQWSRTRYSLRDFISSQRMDTLPAVVRVADGYIDDDDQSHNVTEGAVFFVYSVDEQPRVIAQTEDGRYISFSRKCALRFHVILNDQSLGGASVLDEIVERERNNIGDLRIRMSDPGEGGLGPKDAGYEDIRGVLRVLDLFDEKYLLCHPLCRDGFRCVEVVSVPSYLPLSVNVARGWKAATNSDFLEFLIDVRASGHVIQRSYSEQPTRNSEEIVVFSDLPNGDYELIIPSSSSSSSPLEMSRIPSFKVFDKRKTKSSPDDSSGSEVVVSPLPSSSSSRPFLPPRKLSGGWTSLENPPKAAAAAALHLARRPLPPVPDEKPETGSGLNIGEHPTKIRTKEEEEREEDGKKTKTVERKEKKSAKKKNKKKNFFAFMKDTSGRYSPHRSSDEAMDNPVPEEEEEQKGEREGRKGPKSYVRKRPKGFDRKWIPERRPEMIPPARNLTVDGDEMLNCGREVIWTGSRDKTGSEDRLTLGCSGLNSSSSSSSLTSLQEQRCPRPLVTFSRNITAAAAAAAKAAEGGGGRVKPPVAKKPTSSSSACLPSSTTTTTVTTAKTERMTEVQSTRGTASSSSSLAKKVSVGKLLPELDLGDSGMFSSSVEPRPSIQSSFEGERRGGGGGGDVDEYESFYDVIQSPRGKRASSGPDDEDGSSGGGGVYPETPDADFRWDPLRYPQKKKSSQPHRRTDKSPESDDDYDDEGNVDSSSYEEISSPLLRLLHPPRPSSPSTITPFHSSSSSLSTFEGGGGNRQQSSRPDSTACNLLMISLHEEETAPRALPSPPSSAHQHLWTSIDDVPADISSLSVEQVSACLNVLNLGQYVRSFREHQIDGALLACLDREVLVGDFRFRSFEAIKLVKFARDGWRPRIKENETNA